MASSKQIKLKIGKINISRDCFMVKTDSNFK